MADEALDLHPTSPQLPIITNMDDEGENHQLYQGGTSFLTPDGRRFVLPPDFSAKVANLCKKYTGTSHDTEMLDDEEDADYEEEEEEEDDKDDNENEEDEIEEDYVDGEEQPAELVNMGSFSEPGRKFLSKVWKEYEPIKVDGIVTAAKCKHCARTICAGCQHGTSSLRKHLKRCKERRKALRVVGQLNASIMSPEGIALGPWTFNQAVSRKELMRMIVLHELPFSLVEYEGFRRFVSSLNPSFKMICRNTVKNDCLKEFAEEKRWLQGLFKNTSSKVSLTSDMWTSNRTVGYIVITAHCIDERWQQQKRIVKFTAMETPHTGVAMFNTMIKFIREWGIEDKLFAVTLDNAGNNGAMMKLLKKHLLTKKMLLSSGRLFHQRCAAHVINLICQAGLEFLDPMIEKIRDTVKYIRSSAARQEKFEEIVVKLGISCGKRPRLDVCTRWNSTYLMLSTAKEFRVVFDSLHIQDTNYNFRPTNEEWEKADVICRLLKVFYEATNVISGTKYPTSNLYLHEMLKVKLTMDQQPLEEGSEMYRTLKYMKKKFDKYWKISWLDICIPVILDPQFKLEYLEFRFHGVFQNDATWMINKIKNVFQGLFKEYLKSNSNVAVPTSHGGDVEMSVTEHDPLASWDQHVTRSARSTNEASLELETYLKKVPIRRSDQFNILAWWQMNSTEYPTLSRMARDILAVPASTIASESAFSTGSRIISDFRSRLTPATVEALVCLQDWIRATAGTERSIESVHDIILSLEGWWWWEERSQERQDSLRCQVLYQCYGTDELTSGQDVCFLMICQLLEFLKLIDQPEMVTGALKYRVSVSSLGMSIVSGEVRARSPLSHLSFRCSSAGGGSCAAETQKKH